MLLVLGHSSLIIFTGGQGLHFTSHGSPDIGTRCKDEDNTGKKNVGYRFLTIDEGIES